LKPIKEQNRFEGEGEITSVGVPAAYAFESLGEANEPTLA